MTSEKHEFAETASQGANLGKEFHADEKALDAVDTLNLEEEDAENSRIEAVRLVVPITDDPSLICVTFRFWVLSLFFSIIAAVVSQYYYFRSTAGPFSMFFVNLASYSMGKGMAKVLPTHSFSLFGYKMSFNPGPFNIKEHALIGIAVSTASNGAYAIDILAATDLYLKHRVSALGSLILIITTQSVGYGMAGILRKYLVYPAEMVWWTNLVSVVFYNAMHNTEEYKSKKMIRGWSYMKYFWVFCGAMFIWEFIPQWLAPMFLYFDWLCWINPFNFDFWALFSSIKGGGIMSLSFDWTSIGGSTMWLPLSTQLCTYGGMILSYWIIFPIIWMNNILGTKTIGKPLTSHLFYSNGSAFHVTEFLNADYSLNDDLYNAGPPARMSPMYALGFMTSFIALAGCISHVICFNGKDIWKSWKSAVASEDEDIHTKMMRVYPEVPQLWYAIFYIFMVALSIVACEVYDLQLPWWGLLVALVLGWSLTLPICAMVAITGAGPGLNVITELVCGYMLPGKPIANMTFKCYGFMTMAQCQSLLGDLKLGHYMKIPPRAMFVAQFWGTIIGGVLNYATMVVIINAHRSYLDGTDQDPQGLWTGYNADTFWGSALIYGALGPKRTFDTYSGYNFVFYGFLIGAIFPVVLWGLSKKYPGIQWTKCNVAIIAGGMSAFPNGYSGGVLPSLIVCIIFQYYIFRYHKGWWQKYVFILSAALDTGAAFTGLVMFVFLGGTVTPSLAVNIPAWWANSVNGTDPNAPNWPYSAIDRCGAANDAWTGGLL